MRIPKAAELVAAEVRRQIVGGEVDEGDPLPHEADLMRLYGVSRPTVREALRVLEAEGLVEVKRGVRGGPRVCLPDVSVTARHAALLLQMRGTTLVDLAGARRLLEPAAVREVARRATPADVQTLRASLEDERTAGDDYRASAHRATLFHALLIELTGNQTLALLNELLVGILDTQNRTTVERLAPPIVCEIVESARNIHERLVDLIEVRDADGAERLWTQHLDATVRLTEETFGSARLVDISGLD